MHGPLPQEFFARPAPEIAQELLGKFLIRKYNDHHWTLMITEVEAFEGPDDKASRAYHHGRTEQTEAMFAQGGTLHVSHHTPKETLEDFFAAEDTNAETVVPQIPEAHTMLHIATGPVDYPATVLIRSALIMLPTGAIEYIEGPANITRFLKIGREFDGIRLGKECALWVEDRDVAIPPEHIQKNKRVGADHTTTQDETLYNFSITIAQNKDLSEQ